MSDRETDIMRLAEAVADGRPVDWEAASSDCPDEVALLEELRAVAVVARVHHPEIPGALSPETWGPLRLLERIGAGGFGEIYRAFDPALQREVALKLWRVNRAPPAAARLRYLAEARRLARIRHPNVVTIHGADDHDGRVGLWMELVRGSTLEDCLGRQGPFSADEACAVGASLCRALAAVHSAGLVHRDVKSTNAIREEGGRVVLLDLGAAGETYAGRATDGALSGTLHSMAPEQARGEDVGPPADLYALGVLLYRLASGRYPIRAADLAELVAKLERGERTPLADVRPDLPAGFTRAVERALETDPARRFASAGEMERALVAAMGGSSAVVTPVPVRPGGSWNAFTLGLAVVLVAGGAVIAGTRLLYPPSHAGPSVQTSPPAAPVQGAGGRVAPGADASLPAAVIAGKRGGQPLAPLEVRARLFRHSGASDQPLGTAARVREGDSLYMTVSASEPLHVYVVDQDDRGGVFVLFPLAGLDLRNPLAAHRPHRLPGTRRGRTVDWQVGGSGGRETVVAIASREPLEELERSLAGMPGAEPARGVPGGIGAASEERLPRGIDRTVEEPPSAADAARRLSQLLNALVVGANGPATPWVWRITLEHSAP